MSKKYVTGGFSYGQKKLIREIEIDRETEKSVWVNGSRRDKVSQYEWFHDSWMAAKDHLLRRAESLVESHERSLNSAKRLLEETKALAEDDHGGN